jgi:hypothetical protein
MDGKGVAQRVRRDRLGEARPVPHGPAGILNCGGGDRLTRQIAGEQPLLRPNSAVIVSEDLQELGRKHDVSVLPPLALLDADGHAPAIDRCRRQMDRLRNPQTRRVADGQDHAVLEALDSVEEFADLLRAHHDGKCLRPTAGWNDVIDVPSPLKRNLVEKADGGHRHADRAGREPPGPVQVE